MYQARTIEHYLSLLAPRLLAAPAELLLDALGSLSAASDVLEVCAGAGVLTAALSERVASTGSSLVVADADWRLLRHIALPEEVHAHFVAAHPRRLPFAGDRFDVVVAGGLLGQRADNIAPLAELRRVLRSGGALYSTGFLRGSFEELFDLLVEVAEAEHDTDASQALQTLNANLLDAEQTHALLVQAGFEAVHVGACEQALFFPGGHAAVQDPLIADLILPVWFPNKRPRPETLERLAQTVDTYFGAQRFALTVRTSIVRAFV